MKVLIFSVVASCFLFFDAVQAANPSEVVINEISWMGTTASYNDEWIELRNNSGLEINLEGWILKAADGTPEIKLTGSIPANGFYFLERTNDDTVPGITADQIYTGALGNSGENLGLYDNLGNLIDSVDASSGWPAGDNTTKQTMERSLAVPSAANWQNSQEPGGTPKAENSKVADVGSPLFLTTTTPPTITEESYEVEPRKIVEPIVYPSGIVISEILPSSIGADEEKEWIEIFNKNNFEVDLSGWEITDIAGKTEVYVFPEKTIITPAGFLVLSRPTTKITLNNQGDGLKIIQPNGNIINEVNYENAPRGESYSRFDYGWSWTLALTPGAVNLLPAATSAPAQEEKREEKTADTPSPQVLAAVGEQVTKNSNSYFLFLAAVFTSFLSGAIILILRHVRT